MFNRNFKTYGKLQLALCTLILFMSFFLILGQTESKKENKTKSPKKYNKIKLDPDLETSARNVSSLDEYDDNVEFYSATLYLFVPLLIKDDRLKLAVEIQTLLKQRKEYMLCIEAGETLNFFLDDGKLKDKVQSNMAECYEALARYPKAKENYDKVGNEKKSKEMLKKPWTPKSFRPVGHEFEGLE